MFPAVSIEARIVVIDGCMAKALTATVGMRRFVL